MSSTTVRGQIDQFLALERLALVGVSQNPEELGRRLYRDMRQFGYQAIPVNPHTDTIDGEHCFSRVQDITPPVQAALLLTPPSANEQVVRDCAEAGIRLVWFYGVGDASKANAQAIAYCEQQGISVIPGFCPYMFMSKVALLPQDPWLRSPHDGQRSALRSPRPGICFQSKRGCGPARPGFTPEAAAISRDAADVMAARRKG